MVNVLASPPLRFGIFPTPDASRFEETLLLARTADEAGLDLVGVQDHPYQRRFLDTFSLLAVILARTERIAVFPDVANLPLRGAPIIAKTAASLDVMFPGRFRLGLGAGGHWDAIDALGGPRRSPGAAVDAFQEALAVVRALWSGQRGLRVEGDHYRLAGAHSGPLPVSDLQIWTGAGGRRMLEITGRLCEGWIPSSPYVPPERLDERHRVIDEAAREAGRDPSEVRRIYNVSGRIRSGPAGGFLDGDQAHWVAILSELVSERRMDAFLLMVDEEAETQVRAFSEIAHELRRK